MVEWFHSDTPPSRNNRRGWFINPIVSDRPQKGGLFPEDGRRTRPVVSEYTPEQLPENGRDGLRARILKLLQGAHFQVEVTDSCTLKTVNGPRQLVYPEGWPDVTAVIPVTGRIWVIEVKTEDGEVRPAQEDRLLELTASGALVTLARSVGDVSDELKRQIELLWKERRREYQNYLTAITLLRRAAAQRAAEREAKKCEPRTRRRRTAGAPKGSRI